MTTVAKKGRKAYKGLWMRSVRDAEASGMHWSISNDGKRLVESSDSLGQNKVSWMLQGIMGLTILDYHCRRRSGRRELTQLKVPKQENGRS